MCCAILTVFDVSMATTQLTSVEGYETVRPLHQPQRFQQRHPAMNWVVVIDNNGMRQLGLRWCMVASDS